MITVTFLQYCTRNINYISDNRFYEGQTVTGQTPYPRAGPSASHPQPSVNAPTQHIPQQPPQHVQPPQQQYINSNNNAPVSPVSPYMHTHPQYPQGNGSLIHSAPLPQSPVHSIVPQQSQYGPMYSNVPVQSGLYPGQFATQPHSPGHIVYQGQPINSKRILSNN